MNTIKPQDVVSFFSDEAARVNDEVFHIAALLTQRVPGSNRPMHITGGCYRVKILPGDEAFMLKVAQAFEAMGEGWSSRIVKAHDITGKHLLFILTHESLAALDDGGEYEDDGL